MPETPQRDQPREDEPDAPARQADSDGAAIEDLAPGSDDVADVRGGLGGGEGGFPGF